jgi:hypothetical protein
MQPPRTRQRQKPTKAGTLVVASRLPATLAAALHAEAADRGTSASALIHDLVAREIVAHT